MQPSSVHGSVLFIQYSIFCFIEPIFKTPETFTLKSEVWAFPQKVEDLAVLSLA